MKIIDLIEGDLTPEVCKRLIENNNLFDEYVDRIIDTYIVQNEQKNIKVSNPSLFWSISKRIQDYINTILSNEL